MKYGKHFRIVNLHLIKIMSARNLASISRKTTNVIAASGWLRNEHFLLTADHILLEVDAASFELVTARAEGNIQVHLNTPDPEGEIVIFAQGACFQPLGGKLDLTGCTGSRENGVEIPANWPHRELSVPTSRLALLPDMQDQAEKRLPILHAPLRAAA